MGLTSNTSSSRILVPKTVMPLVLTTARSLLPKALVTFFLQSTMMVTVFFSTLMAMRCHLGGERKHKRNDESEAGGVAGKGLNSSTVSNVRGTPQVRPPHHPTPSLQIQTQYNLPPSLRYYIQASFLATSTTPHTPPPPTHYLHTPPPPTLSPLPQRWPCLTRD